MLLLLLFFSLRYKEGLDYIYFVNIVVIVVVLGYKEGLDYIFLWILLLLGLLVVV